MAKALRKIMHDQHYQETRTQKRRILALARKLLKDRLVKSQKPATYEQTTQAIADAKRFLQWAQGDNDGH